MYGEAHAILFQKQADTRPALTANLAFDPTNIDSDTTASIDCEVPPGLPVSPESLRSMGGTFTNSITKQVFPTSSVVITDPQGYTSFQIVADSLPEGHYTITILLGPTGAVGDIYRLTSEHDLYVKPARPAKISRIVPNSVTVAELKNKNFRITGDSLDKIQTSAGFYLQTPAYKFQSTGASESTVVLVRYSPSSSIPEPGVYRVLARDSEGSPYPSTATLTIQA